MSPSQATASSSSNRSDTAERLLDLAQERIQQRGYNAVSYGDFAEGLDLTTAAIQAEYAPFGTNLNTTSTSTLASWTARASAAC